MRIELCRECGDPTHRAGRGEDSIYVDGKGPYCLLCWEKYYKPKPTTEYVYPPIPSRAHDWIAYYDPEGKTGHGATEAEALASLEEAMEDER